jgi:hypothetical protein
MRDQKIRGDGPLSAVFGDGSRVPARATPDGDVEVVVPALPAGENTVSVFQGQRRLGRGRLNVLDAATRQLAIAYGREGFTLLRSTPAAGPPTGHVRSRQPRLSFDLINAQGAVVYSGTVVDPSQVPGEVLTQATSAGGPAWIGRGGTEQEGLILIRVPTPPGPVTLKVYRAPEKLDLFTTDGRAGRRLVSTLEVRP